MPAALPSTDSEPRHSAISPRRGNWPHKLLCLVPAFIFLALVRAHLLPREERSRVIDLAGEWRVHEGDAGPDSHVPDGRASWRRFRVPGGYTLQGFKAPNAWLARDFSVPTWMLGQELYLLLGDMRSGVAEVFLNDHRVGGTQTYAGALKAELSGTDAWSVPSTFVRAGSNALTLRVHWSYPGQDGIFDSRVLLGPKSVLGPYYLGTEDLRRLIQYGTVFALGILIIFFVAIVRFEDDREKRNLYRTSIGLLLAAGGYVGVNSGVLLGLSNDSPNYFPVMYGLVLALCLTVMEWTLRFSSLSQSRFLKANRIVISLFALAFVAINGILGSRALLVPYELLSLYALLSIGLICPLAVGRIATGTVAEAYVGVAILITALSGGFDMLRDIGLTRGPRMFPLALGFTSVMCGSVLVADFVLIAIRNRNLRANLERVNANLVQTNADLNSALMNSEQASRLKSEFVATVSHELRTPLNAIINLPEGLLERFVSIPAARCEACAQSFQLEPTDSLSEATLCPACKAPGRLRPREVWRYQGDLAVVADNLQRVHRSGQHLLALVNDVLDFSRLETGKSPLSLQHLDLADILRGALVSLDGSLQKAGIAVRIDVPPQGALLDADLVKLGQVFVNLLSNSLKFSPRGSEVLLQVRRAPDADAWLASVIDHGIGIAPENHTVIFESFRQVEGGHTRKFGGTGLGLAITKKLVELHGGKIWVESSLGNGAAFHVLLPLSVPRPLPI